MVRRVRRVVQHLLIGGAVCVTAVGTAFVASPANSADPTATPAVPISSQAPVQSPAPAPVAADAHGRRTLDSRSTERRALSAKDKQTAAKVASQRAQALARQQQAIKARAKALAKAEAEKKAKVRARGYAEGVSDPREIARQIMANKFSWGSGEFRCYDSLIKSESMWRIDATNPSSGAYGIPQALPGTKMASEGEDWQTNPATQVVWGLKYVQSRYGTPCNAWSFKQGHNWY
jgi:hypothetical protein